jgi:hypothetical protein
MARPVPSGQKAIPFLQEHQRAIIIALVRAGLKLARTLLVPMPCPGKPGDVLARSL